MGKDGVELPRGASRDKDLASEKSGPEINPYTGLNGEDHELFANMIAAAHVTSVTAEEKQLYWKIRDIVKKSRTEDVTLDVRRILEPRQGKISRHPRDVERLIKYGELLIARGRNAPRS